MSKTPREILDALAEPFPTPAIMRRPLPGSNKQFDYVSGNTVINRLNAVCGDGGWSFELIGQPWEIQKGVIACIGSMEIPGLGRRQHVGVVRVTNNMGEDMYKTCATDALKKCASLFGVAKDLYGPDYEEDYYAQQQEQAARQAGGEAKPGDARSIHQERRAARSAASRPATAPETPGVGDNQAFLVLTDNLQGLGYDVESDAQPGKPSRKKVLRWFNLISDWLKDTQRASYVAARRYDIVTQNLGAWHKEMGDAYKAEPREPARDPLIQAVLDEMGGEVIEPLPGVNPKQGGA